MLTTSISLAHAAAPVGWAQEIVQVQAEPNERWLVILLFLLAGLFAGGAWSGYKNAHTPIMIIAGLMTVVTLAAAGFWLVSEI
ncbi:MAG: hypothetical protein SPI77_05990 [Corynebacterium sp.]|nr:hypothetical protein [Corynebacterium sp.]